MLTKSSVLLVRPLLLLLLLPLPWPRPMATVLEPGSGPEVCVSVLSEALVPEWSVCEWLQAIGMERYRDTLAAAGYSSFPSLLALTHQ